MAENKSAKKIFKTGAILLVIILICVFAYDLASAQLGKENWLSRYLPDTLEEIRAQKEAKAQEVLASRFIETDQEAQEKLLENAKSQSALENRIKEEERRLAREQQLAENAAAEDDGSGQPYITPEDAALIGGNSSNNDIGRYLDMVGGGLGGLGF